MHGQRCSLAVARRDRWHGCAIRQVRAEERQERDVLFVDAPETRMVITEPTKHSGGKRLGRGLPTFKQFAFFARAAKSGASWIGKLDDDSLPNPAHLGALLRSLRCHTYALVGSIQFSGYVPRSYANGIRGLPCAQGAGLYDSLLTFARPVSHGWQ